MTTKLPGLPPIPSNASSEVKAYLKAVGEVLEVRAGRRGDPLDRAITLRELIDSGLATQLKAAPFDPNNINVGNLGFSNQPTNSAIPPAPTTLTASAGLKYVLLEYNNPKLAYLNHGFAEVYRHTSDTIGDAILVGTSPTFTFSDAPSTAGTYYYWVRFVSDTGVVGPFNATAGTSATIQTDVSFLLQTLTSSISASQLTTSLANQIDGSGSAADLAALETFVGFDSTTSITPGTNDLKALIDLNETAANSVKTMIGWTSTYSGDNLTTRIGDNETDITALQTTVNDSSTGVAASATAISALQTDLATAEGNISTNTSDITALESTVNDSSTGVAATATALSNLTTRVTTAEGTISTNTSDITTLENTVNDSTSGVAANATAITGLGTRLTTAEGSITSQASDISDLNAEVFDSSGNGVLASITSVNTVSSAVTALEGQVFESDGTTPRLATAASVSTLNTTVGGNTTSIQTAQTSINGLEGQYTVKIDSNGNVAGFGLANTSSAAGSSSEFTVRADRFAIVNSSNNQTTSPFIVQTTQQTIGGVTVPAGVYIDGAQIKNASIDGAKIANATIGDAKITNGLSANKITVGTLDAGRLNLDNQTITTVGGAIAIKDLGVDSAKINNAAITTAKINNGAITNAKIGNAAIQTANIGDLQVNRLKIANGAVSDYAQFSYASATTVSRTSFVDTGLTGSYTQEAGGSILLMFVYTFDGPIYNPEIQVSYGNSNANRFATTWYNKFVRHDFTTGHQVETVLTLPAVSSTTTRYFGFKGRGRRGSGGLAGAQSGDFSNQVVTMIFFTK